MNTIAIRVYRDHFQSIFDCNGDWALSGIFRDVYLFAVPTAFIEDLTIQTQIGKSSSTALIIVKMCINHFYEKNPTIEQLYTNIRLSYKKKGIFDQSFKVHWPNFKFLPDPVEFTIPVANPHLWTAETPYLYDLEIILKGGDKKLHTLQKRVGLREVTIEGAVFKYPIHQLFSFRCLNCQLCFPLWKI